MNEQEQALFEDAQKVYPPSTRVVARPDDDGWVAELTKIDGTIVWPLFAHGPTELLAVLAAEQRYLVEEEGGGAVRGGTYVEKAEERLRRWLNQ